MRKIETFTTEEEVAERIEKLKSEGIDEIQITLVANRDLEAGGALEEYSEVKIKSSDGNVWEKIMAFFTNDEPEEQVADTMDLTTSEEKKFMEALDSDKILLHVDGQATIEGQGKDILSGQGAGAKDLTGTGAEGRGDLGAEGMTKTLNPFALDDEIKRKEKDIDDTPKDKK